MECPDCGNPHAVVVSGKVKCNVCGFGITSEDIRKWEEKCVFCGREGVEDIEWFYKIFDSIEKVDSDDEREAEQVTEGKVCKKCKSRIIFLWRKFRGLGASVVTVLEYYRDLDKFGIWEASEYGDSAEVIEGGKEVKRVKDLITGEVVFLEDNKIVGCLRR